MPYTEDATMTATVLQQRPRDDARDLEALAAILATEWMSAEGIVGMVGENGVRRDEPPPYAHYALRAFSMALASRPEREREQLVLSVGGAAEDDPHAVAAECTVQSPSDDAHGAREQRRDPPARQDAAP